MGNKSAGAIFGTFIRRFHISTALSDMHVPIINAWKNPLLLLLQILLKMKT